MIGRGCAYLLFFPSSLPSCPVHCPGRSIADARSLAAIASLWPQLLTTTGTEHRSSPYLVAQLFHSYPFTFYLCALEQLFFSNNINKDKLPSSCPYQLKFVRVYLSELYTAAGELNCRQLANRDSVSISRVI